MNVSYQKTNNGSQKIVVKKDAEFLADYNTKTSAAAYLEVSLI